MLRGWPCRADPIFDSEAGRPQEIFWKGFVIVPCRTRSCQDLESFGRVNACFNPSAVRRELVLSASGVREFSGVGGDRW